MMAKYDHLGYCPDHSFLQNSPYDKSPISESQDFWGRTYKLLGARTYYMVYTNDAVNYKGDPYAVDCLVRAKSTIGIEIASLLKFMIPQCEYGEKKIGRKIVMTDVINPFQIPHIRIRYIDGKDTYVSDYDTMHVFEDERYLCGVIDEGEVKMYFYKK